jgi:dTDP-4-amino-4,6-dideoxygalactose transaminase
VRDKEHFLAFGAPQIERAEIDEVIATLESRWLGTGPRTKQFEADFARYKGVEPEHVIGVSSCTAALHLSFVLLDLEPGDEVITTPLTFAATVNAILHAGGTPVLADVDPRTMNIDPERARERITARTRAIVPVHFAGRGAEMEALLDIAEEHGLRVVEDAAHAVETRCGGRPAGTLGDFGCFSFYATKNVVTGEGGMVIARSRDDAERVRRLGLHGLSRDAWARFGSAGYRHYEVVEAGFKYNLMDIQSALGIHQLARVEENLVRRRQVWERYEEALADLPVERPAPLPGDDDRHALHLYTVLIDEKAAGKTRDQVLERMAREGIGVGVHYLSIPEHPYYRERFGWALEDFPAAVDIGRRTMSLPLTPALADQDVEDALAALRLALGAD